MPLKTSIRGHTLVITLDNPPVNALGVEVRTALLEAIKSVPETPNIQNVIITGSPTIFSAGADIKEFGQPPSGPSLPDVISEIENCPLPTLALIRGAAFGGGCELALACRYRASSTAGKFALPEVNLGLIPGAGGTQRLPRLIGVDAAAEMILSGKPVGANKAKSIGLVDVVLSDGNDAEGDAIKCLSELSEASVREPLSAIDVPKGWDKERFEQLAAKTERKARGQKSPLAALEAIKAAATLSFSEGLKKERELFLECRESQQRDALVHAFFAEKQASKLERLKGVMPVSIKTIGVLGAGTMGTGISLACLNANFQVTLFDVDGEALNAARDRIERTLNDNVKKGRTSANAAENAMSNLSLAGSLDAFSHTDLIIEAVVEKMDVKKSIFSDLDRICQPEAILATNTSYLDVNEIAAVTGRPKRLSDYTSFSPANIMKLLEIVETDLVSDETLSTAFSVAKRLGKVAVRSGVCDGFIGNRILKAYRAEAEFLLEDGAMPEQIDRIMRDFGFAMGPFQVSDLAGIDIGWHNRRREDAMRDPAERYVDIADKLYDLGRLGQKTQAGWYDYDETRKPTPSPIVKELVLDASRRRGLTRDTLSDEEILHAILTRMYDEGSAILAEGIALSSSDIDMVMIHGYGFPKFRGGLMYYGNHNNLGARRSSGPHLT